MSPLWVNVVTTPCASPLGGDMGTSQLWPGHILKSISPKKQPEKANLRPEVLLTSTPWWRQQPGSCLDHGMKVLGQSIPCLQGSTPMMIPSPPRATGSR